MIGEIAAQNREVVFAPQRDAFELVTVGHCAADDQLQNFGQEMRAAPSAARVVDAGKQGLEARLLGKTSKARLIGRLQNQTAHREYA